MKLVYAKKEGKEINFYIGGIIGEEVNGSYIESDILLINKNKLADRINIYINSEGGEVKNGVRIISAIFNSSIPVHTYNRGFAMSMAGFIWLAARKENRHASFFSDLMLHSARFVNQEKEIVIPENEDDKIYLKVVNTMLSDIMQNATGKSKEDIIELLSKDTHFNSDECVLNGLMDSKNIIKYGKMPQFDTEATVQDKILTIAAFYKELDNNLKTNNMTLVAAKLGLNAEASEEAKASKIDSINAEKDKALKSVTTLEATIEKDVQARKEAEAKTTEKIKALETKIQTFEEKEKTLKAEMAKQVVETYEKEGKIKAEAKETMIAMAANDLESFKALMNSLNFTVKGVDIAAQLQGTSNITEEAAKYGIKAEEMNYEFLWKNKPEVLAKLEKDNPALHATLVANW